MRRSQPTQAEADFGGQDVRKACHCHTQCGVLHFQRARSSVSTQPCERCTTPYHRPPLPIKRTQSQILCSCIFSQPCECCQHAIGKSQRAVTGSIYWPRIMSAVGGACEDAHRGLEPFISWFFDAKYRLHIVRRRPSTSACTSADRAA